MMINDRQIIISAGSSRRDMHWQVQTLQLSELYTKLATPARGTESLEQYLTLPKGQQDDLKDVGGFVGGALKGPRRKAGAVAGRDILTLDLDNIPAGGTADVLRRVDALGCGYCVYSTRKHMPAAPRLRIILPLDRMATADEYEPCARRMAEMIGMELTDPTTFEASRLMYWPSCCADSEYIYIWQDKPLLSADGLLATYADWHDYTSWPQVPGVPSPQRLATKQGDPLTKTGVVGAFCRCRSIEDAMEIYIPGVYAPVDSMPGRYTYTGGSTTGGAVLYDDGKFLYSHHATDPCGGKLVNSYDMVRLHRFEDLDDAATPGTPVNRLPSYTAMCELATADPQVSGLLLKERWESATEGFAAVSSAEASPGEEEDGDWRQLLKVSAKTGMPQGTIDNVWIILEHDPMIRGKFALNKFAGRGEVLAALPWCDETGRRLWDDNDNAGLYWYMEKYYGINSCGKIDNALSLHSRKHSFNDVVDYLEGLSWDGIPRLDTMLVDYLGAADTEYTRAVTRKAFTAAVARAMMPGVKFDQMTILSGPQGIGKSTLLRKMSRGWFNDSLRTFEGKEASELLQGVWLVEIAELQAFRSSDTNRIKQFVSQQADRFRAAYGRHVKEMPRCCVFFGTTNSKEYLRDRTGNRRFWPVDSGTQAPVKDVFTQLDGEIDQLWAEAVVRWRLGEPLYLAGALAQEAAEEQEGHRETSPREGQIIEFVAQRVPKDWSKWSQDRRRPFWGGMAVGDIELVDRDRICAQEVWCEALGGNIKDMKYSDSQEINDVIAQIPGWMRSKKAVWFGGYGSQKGFVKT